MGLDLERSRREALRWRILQTLNVGRPYPIGEDVLLTTVGGPDMPVTPMQLRRELEYLEHRKLIQLAGKCTSLWSAELNRYGVDVVEYTIDCDPGIARPRKYW